MATLQGKAVKNTYRQVLQIGANNVGVSGSAQRVQDGAGVNTALSLSTVAATVHGDLTITGDLIITGGGIQIQDLIDDTVASLIQNGTGITWAYNDGARTLTPTITIATADGGVQGDFLQLNTGANEASAVGKLKWNATDGTMDIGLMGGNVVLQVGQEQVIRVVNNTGASLTEAAYQAVRIGSAQGQRLAVLLAQGNNNANSKDTLGLVTETIANNQEGFITTSGLVRQIDTTGDLQTEVWVDGDVLYLSPTIAGAVTKVKPIAPQQVVVLGFVVYAHKTQGKIYVKVDNGSDLSELHDVKITSVANNNILKYNSSTALWENVAGTTTNIAEGTNLYYTQARFDTAFAAKSTTNLTEGSNLYYTQARFDTAFSNKSTTNLAEGANLYYTQARFNSALAAKTTTDLAEGSNLYYTDTRARLALSSSATGLSYANNSGVFSLTAGYAIPTTVKLGQYDIAYNRSIVSAAVSGTTTKTLSLTQQDANVVTATWTDLGITTINGTANQIAATTAGNTTTLAFTNDVTMPNNLVVSGNLTINGTATYVNTQSISAKDPLFEVANDNNTTDVVDIGYYGRFYDTPQTRVEFTGLFRDASDAGKFKLFTGLVDEPTNVVNTTGVGYTVGTLVANFEGNLAGTANAANELTTARTIAASGDATWSVSFNGSANVTSALTLANTGVTATTYGTSTSVPTIAVDSKGRITSASNTNITFPVTTVNSQSGTVVLTTSNIAEGSNQYFTSARAQAAITLTTTGTSGAATYSGGTINIPQYQGVLTNPVTGTGTTNTLPKFTAASAIGNSNITDTGSLITLGSNTTISSGALGIGTSSLTQYGLRLAKNITGAVTSYGISSEGVIQSDAITNGWYYNSTASTAAASFTVGNIVHYFAQQGTFGAGSSVTRQYGIFIASNLIGATNNYGLYSDIPSGTNRWNLYMNGTASNYMAGKLLIGSTTDSGEQLQVTGTAKFTGALSGTSATFSDRVFSSKVINSATISNSSADASFLLYAPTTTNYYGGIIGWAEGNIAASISSYDDGSGGALGLSFATGNNASISERLKISSTGAATFSSSITANAASQINGLTQDAIQTIFTIQGYNAAAQSKAIYFQLTGSTPLFTIRTGAVGADAGIAIRPDGTNGLTIPYGTGAATFSSSATATSFIPSGATVPTNGMYLSAANTLNFATNTTNRLSISSTGNVSIGTTSALQTLTLAGTQMMYNTAGDGVTNVIIGSITSQVRSFGGGIATSSFASIQFATDSTSWFKGDIRFLTNGSDGTASAGTERMRITSGGIVAIGVASPNASAKLQVDSTTQGFLPPVMTTTQKNAIATPATGLVVFDSTLGKLCVFSTTWQTITSV